MYPENFILDLVRNRSQLDARAAELMPMEYETPRQWFTRTVAYLVFGAYCTFRRVGASGELTPNWPSLLCDPVTRGNFNLRLASFLNYAEDEIAIDILGSDMLADDSQEFPGATSDSAATMEDLLTAESEEESVEDGMG